MQRANWLLLGALLATGSCTQPNPEFLAGDPDLSPTGDLGLQDTGRWDRGGDDRRLPPDGSQPPSKPRGVDVLLVVDNTTGMKLAQQQLGNDIAALLAGLDNLPGGANYRLGVTTSDIGVGSHANLNCTGKGDEGKLQFPPWCPGGQGKLTYLEKIGTATNVTAPLAEVAACLIDVGEEGCGFEQPLEATRTALGSANQGFLRPDAALALVILTNEDDCSAVSSSFYDPKDLSLGPYTSYRCFQHGVLCNGIKPPLGTTLLQNCQPGQDRLWDVADRYVAPLLALKPPGWVSALVLAAPPQKTTEVGVSSTSNGLVWFVKPSCSQGYEKRGDPAFRLQAFASQLQERGAFTSFCSPSYAQPLKSLVDRVRAAF